MRFVVTGLSRSGTKYAAKLWTQLGYRCGHESVFNIFKVMDRPERLEELRGFGERDGDSSFLAAPFLDELPEGTVVFHQVREPLEVIRSHLGIRFFADPAVPSMYLAENHSDFVDYVTRYCPRVAVEATEAERCMRYWVDWNRLIRERVDGRNLTYVRYRIEDLDEELLRSMVARLGDEVQPSRLTDALTSVARSTNTRVRDDSLGWDDLPEGEAKSAVAELAETYGYAPLGVH